MNGFREKWSAIRRELAAGGADAFWLLHHASYLLRTDGALWLVDPVLSAEEHALAGETLREELGSVRAVFITHLHADHFDTTFLRAMAACGAELILPAFVPEAMRQEIRGWTERVRFVEAGERVSCGPLLAEPFVSLHRDVYQGTVNGVDEMGYRVEAGGRSFLVPGDVRSYEQAPSLAQADELFAHVWLGRREALRPEPCALAACCRYFAAAHAGRVWLTHLEDDTREPEDRWTREHAEMVRAGILALTPGADVRIPAHGEMQHL